MRLNSGEKSAAVTDAPMPIPMTAIPQSALAGVATYGLWVADVFLSVAALWLGGFSTMAGHPEALWLGGILVVIGGFLGLVAAGIFCRG